MTTPAVADAGAALRDGDVITPATLHLLRQHPTTPPAPRAQARPQAPAGPPPLLIARPRRCTGADITAAHQWLDHCDPHGPGRCRDEHLLHALETSALLRPPVPLRARDLPPGLTALYLRLCEHWTGHDVGDPRWLNATLKLLAVVTTAAGPPGTAAALPGLVDAHAAALARLNELATAPQPAPLAPAAAPPATAPDAAGDPAAPGGVRIAVLAGSGSRGLPRFLTAMTARNVPVDRVVLVRWPPAGARLPSAYDTAWYPDERAPAPAERDEVRPADCPITTVSLPARHPGTSPDRRWEPVAAQLRRAKPDLVVLLGMDVVPPSVLDIARLGTVNAHNGRLPQYRGMDAAGWATLAGDLVVCTVHYAVADVDAGTVLAEQTIDPATPYGMREAVKAAQIDLLTSVCAFATAHRALPPGRAQDPHRARRFYRMHPALKRVLDHRRAAAHTPTTQGGRPA